MNNLAATVMENIVFVLEFLGLVVAVVLIAYFAERFEKKRTDPHHTENCDDRRLFRHCGRSSHAGFPDSLRSVFLQDGFQ